MTKRCWILLLALLGCGLEDEAQPLLLVPQNTPMRWYAVQLHAHSDLGGGSKNVRQLRKMAIDAGLDAIVISDHNDLRQTHSRYFKSDERLTMIRGLEWGAVERDTPGGHHTPEPEDPGEPEPDPGRPDGVTGPHAGVLNIQGDDTLPVSLGWLGMIQQAHQRGATVIANHPYLSKHRWPQPFPAQMVEGVEVWNGRFSYPIPGNFSSFNQQAITWWHQYLVQGGRLTAVAGNDFHRWPQDFDGPAILVQAPDKSPASLMNGIRAGRVVLIKKTRGARAFLEPMPDGVKITALACQGQVASLFTAQGLARRIMIPSDHYETTWQFPGEIPAWVRMEVRPEAEANDMTAMTNAVYLR